MAEDKEWAAVYEVVLAGLKEWAFPDDEQVELAQTVTDHVVAAFRTEPRQ